MVRITIVAHYDTRYSREIVFRIRDGIHSQGSRISIMDMSNINISILEASDAIIFGCPTIMGSPSSEFKNFMEKTYTNFRRHLFANKFAAGFTYGGQDSGDKSATIQILCNFASQHGMIWIPQGNIAMNEALNLNIQINPINSYLGNISEEKENDSMHNSFVETAYYFGRRISSIVNTRTR